MLAAGEGFSDAEFIQQVVNKRAVRLGIVTPRGVHRPRQTQAFAIGEYMARALAQGKGRIGLPYRPGSTLPCSNAPRASAGGLLAGQRAGLKIPQDCAVLGFGDYPFAEMLLPSLSTIKPPALEIGVLAATRVLESLGVLPVEDEVVRLNLLDCRLIKREST